jgi:hypothetical protein
MPPNEEKPIQLQPASARVGGWSSSDPRLRSAVKIGGTLDAAMLVLASLVLDGGVMARLFCTASVGYWLGVIAIFARRVSSPTRLDLLFTKYGAALLCFLSAFIAKLVYCIIGESLFSGWERLLGT